MSATRQARPAGPRDTLLALVPAGYGSLRQDDIAIKLQRPDVLGKLTPLDESVMDVSYDITRPQPQLFVADLARVTRLRAGIASSTSSWAAMTTPMPRCSGRRIQASMRPQAPFEGDADEDGSVDDGADKVGAEDGGGPPAPSSGTHLNGGRHVETTW